MQLTDFEAQCLTNQQTIINNQATIIQNEAAILTAIQSGDGQQIQAALSQIESQLVTIGNQTTDIDSEVNPAPAPAPAPAPTPAPAPSN